MYAAGDGKGVQNFNLVVVKLDVKYITYILCLWLVFCINKLRK